MPLKGLPYKTLEALIKGNISTDEDEYTKEMHLFLAGVKKRGWLNKDELIEICYWKSPRSIHHIKSNHSRTIKKKSRLAFKTNSEEDRMSFLAQLRGVSIPMGSAILMLVDPKRYGVIDIRVWEVLYALRSVKTNPKGVNFSLSEWNQCLEILRGYSEKFKVTPRVIERTIFEVHQKYQEGNLYRNIMAKNKMTMFGKIYSPGNYKDGVERFEISIYFGEGEKNPFKIGKRVECHLLLGSHKFLCGVRTTKRSGSWVSPDIYNPLDISKRVRLSEVLTKNGFKRKDAVSIVYYPGRKILRIDKAK